MAIKAMWKKDGLKGIISRATDDVMKTIYATLRKLGMSESAVSQACLTSRINLDTALKQFYEGCVYGDRPESLAHAEIMLIVHCALIKVCTAHGATEAVDLGLSTMARRNFYKVFASLDPRRWTVYFQGEVIEYMKAFVRDDYVINPETFVIMDEYDKRLFDASSL